MQIAHSCSRGICLMLVISTAGCCEEVHEFTQVTFRGQNKLCAPEQYVCPHASVPSCGHQVCEQSMQEWGSAGVGGIPER